jgi:hypothetical protein
MKGFAENGRQAGRRNTFLGFLASILVLLALAAYSPALAAGRGASDMASQADKTRPAGPNGGVFEPPGANEPAIASNDSNGEYLAVWYEYDAAEDGGDNNFHIRAQRMSSTGALLGDEMALSGASGGQSQPDVTYNSTDNEYLVVWESRETESSGIDVYGQRVSSSGALLGGNFPIYTAPRHARHPAVAYNNTDNEYLVVWDDGAGISDAEVYGQRVSSGGALVGSDFLIASAYGTQWDTEVAYNSTDNEYLVVWHDYRNSSQDIYGQRVSSSGGLLGGNIPIYTGSGHDSHVEVAYNGTVNEYLAVWEHSASDYSNSDVYGQRVSNAGTLLGSLIPVSKAPGYQYSPSVAYAYIGVIGEYLVTWSDSNPSGEIDVYGQRVSSAGALQGSAIQVYTGPGDQYSSAVAFSYYNGEHMVAWQDLRNEDLGEIYGQRVATGGALVGSDFPISVGEVCNIEFSDVLVGSTFHAFVLCLACRDILGGYDDGTFRPQNQITRGQIAKIVSNAAGYTDDVSGMQTYADVPSTQPFHLWIERLSMRGHMSGYNCGGAGEPCDGANRPYFRPGNNASRGQLSKIVSNAAEFADTPAGQTFEDVPPSSPFYPFIERLTTRGVMSGYPCGGAGEPCGGGNRPYFRPGDNVTRGQASKIVANTFFPECAAD